MCNSSSGDGGGGGVDVTVCALPRQEQEIIVNSERMHFEQLADYELEDAL